MNCAVCSAPAAFMLHKFHQGTEDRPVRKWTITAPLYFKANADHTEMVEGYCSAACATAAFQRGVQP